MRRRLLTGTFAAALLAVCLPAPGEEKDSDVLADSEFRTACGPIARHVALRAIGIEQKLADSVRACGWKEGDLTTLGALCRSLDEVAGINCTAVRISPTELRAYLSEPGHVAILAVKKNGPEVNHVVCVRQETTTDELTVIDYPELVKELPRTILPQIWDGEALLVSRDGPPATSRLLILGTAPAVLVGALFWLVIDRRPVPEKAVLARSMLPQ